MAVAAQSDYRIGERLRVRGQRWLLTEVHGAALTLRGLDRSNAHEPQQLFEPFEQIERLSPDAEDPLSPSPSWGRGRRRWRRVWRDMLRQAGPWTSLRTLDDADVEVWPHQLAPAQSVLRGQGSRLLLADAVGLGKTIQAGVLLAELRARGVVDSALVLTPAGLRDQWRMELRERFRLDATVVDSRHAAKLAEVLPLGMNPWQAQPLAIASVDFVKRPEVLNSVRAVPWDIVIIDEAHGVSPGSDRYAAIAPICANALFVVLLTATPHNGDRLAFAGLCQLGATGDDSDRCLVFRRIRTDVHLPQLRRVHQLRVRLGPAEAAMHAALDQYGRVLHAAVADAEGADLLMSVLRKRALSSPHSLRSSVARRLLALPSADDGARQARLPMGDGEGEWDASDEAPLYELDCPATEQERPSLERLAAAAETAGLAESKLAALARLLRRLQRRRESVVVFTEYRDTLLHVQRCLAPDALVLHGGLDRTERRQIVETFVGGESLVLLTTDAGGEGLNLHQRCRCVVNLEIPWNPVRLEQRTGRVDRIGQRRRVHVFCLVARHASETRLVERVHARVAAADADIGMANPLTSPPPAAELQPSVSAQDGLASAEAGRILRARALKARRGSPDGPARRTRCRIVARARTRIRRGLNRRWLAIIEWTALRDDGRTVASGFTAVALEPAILVGGSGASGTMIQGDGAPQPPVDLRAAAGHAQDRLSESAAALRRHFVERHDGFADVQEFWRVTASRAAAVASAAGSEPAPLFQPGLFDRRAEQLRRLRQDERAAIAALTRARAARLASECAPPAVVATRLLLLLP